MNELIKKINIILEEQYGIENIVAVDRFDPVITKFINNDHHFTVTAINRKYFLKRYAATHIGKIFCEIRSFLLLQKKINIPSIVPNLNRELYVLQDDSIYVLYEFIDSMNLKEGNEPLEPFFDIICNVENLLISLEDKSKYDFSSHLKDFIKESENLLVAMKKDSRPHGARDIRNLEIMMGQALEVFPNIKNLNIPFNFIHGDLLMQNILRDQKDKIWILDWEKSRDYITCIDILRSVTFTFFDNTKKDLGMDEKVFARWAGYCFNKVTLSWEEKAHALDIYYFHMITNIGFLARLYIEGQDLNEKMAEEDFLLCEWFRVHREKIQNIINFSQRNAIYTSLPLC